MMDFLIDMFGIRDPYKSELTFFKKRPEVAGMATEDNKIILNPYSKLSPDELQAVAKNEALRLFMKTTQLKPEFALTKEQENFFKNTEYENNPEAARQTVLSRILTGDPSAKNATPEQIQAARALAEQIKQFEPRQ